MVIGTMRNTTDNTALGMVVKLVKQYFESGELRSRFDVFNKEEVKFGDGYELNVLLAAKAINVYTGDGSGDDGDITGSSGSAFLNEHDSHDNPAICLQFSARTGGQYAVTIDRKRINLCVGNEEAAQAYAAELTESLYQGWINDKNKAVGEAAVKILDAFDARQTGSNRTTIERGADKATYASDVIEATKAQVENLREGVSGTYYGNAFVDDKNIAARNIVILMSNNLAATLDVYGFAKAFTPEYLEANNVTRVTSQKIPDGKVLITDARNIQARPEYEETVEIQNSDGSYNIFYNKIEYIEAAVNTNNIVAFPYADIVTTTAQVAAVKAEA